MRTETAEFRDYEITTRDGPMTFLGWLLGAGTSHRKTHLEHALGSFPIPGQRCSGCRWTETRIFHVAELLGKHASDTFEPSYLIVTVGRSIVPGETNRYRSIWSVSARGVLDALLLHPKAHFSSTELELPQPNEDALEQAANYDPDLLKIYTDWNNDN